MLVAKKPSAMCENTKLLKVFTDCVLHRCHAQAKIDGTSGVTSAASCCVLNGGSWSNI
jgi:hypothetical protein